MLPGATPLRPRDNTAAYFATRGVHLSPDESRELLSILLRLSELGAISAAPADECRGAAPKAPAQAGASRADRGAGVGRRHREPGALEGPTVYNMGPSDYIGAQK